MVEWRKLSEAIGSGTPDPVTNEAAAQPVPPPAVGNKPAPGQTGPKGLSPRTSYTRVNTGAPPVPDAGASGQKSMSPRGMEFLPTKVAHKEKVSMTTMMQRPNLQELVKEAMEGTVSKVDISAEAARQLANVGVALPEQTKTASAKQEYIPTEYIHKLASALDYMAKQADEGTTAIQPGKGPNALGVLEATSSGENIDAGEQGQAKNQPPSTAMESSGVAKDPSNAMATNATMQHPEQPEDPMGNEKGASALFARNLEAMGLSKEALDAGAVGRRAKQIFTGSKARQIAKDLKAHSGALPEAIRGPMKKELMKETAKTVGALGVTGAAATAAGLGAKKALGGKKGEDKETKKEGSILVRNLLALGLIKQAEDAINPAQISAGSTQTGATPPEGASASGEQVPSEPSDVNKQKGLISSNEAAIDYTKGQAKADPKSDVNKVLDEPALSAATDKTLAKTLDNTGKAGVKIAADLMKTAAAQALLSKLAEEACADADAKKKNNKEKQSQGMGGLSNPSGQSGFTATSV